MSHLPSAPDTTLMDQFRAHPEIAAPLHRFAEAVMRGPSPFSAAERELIAAHVSALNRCDFCLASHAGAAERLGIGRDVLDALPEGAGATPVPEPMRPVLAYAEKLTRDPASVGTGDVEAMLGAGWDETAVAHAALVAGFFALMNRWVEGLGIETDPKTVDMAAEMLATRGYAGIAAMLER